VYLFLYNFDAKIHNFRDVTKYISPHYGKYVSLQSKRINANNMKRTIKTMLVVFVTLTTVAFAGCGKEENKTTDTGNGGGSNAEWVDLGLPSGILWADRNVGASTPEDYGDYYAWGETSTKSTYNWMNYAYGNDSDQLTKYCNKSEYGLNGFIDNLMTLESSDDAATVVMGGGARIPTADEWRELKNNTIGTWEFENGVKGLRLTAANGNYIFLPAAGSRCEDALDNVGEQGRYWSSSLDTDGPDDAWGLRFLSNLQYMYDYSRNYGLSVRAVRAR
jgi:uncharacterized protein (TIGR02145 family)